MAYELANAYISLNPSMKGFAKQTERGMAGAGEKASSTWGGAWLKKGAKVLGGAAAAGIGIVAGTAITKGFSRALQLQDAEAKLTGLGHSADGVSKIMDNALAAVKGTAFGMGEAATVAATMVAAGVKPGRDLEGTLRLVGDAATIAGTDMGSMGAIFAKVAASNKVQMDVINQLHDVGVPALSLLADEMGVTAEEASKMASKGEIDFATFQRAMENGLGGAALKSGETFRGALANMGAALGRLGVAFANPLVEGAPGLFTSITNAIDTLGESEAFKRVADSFSAWLLPTLERASDWISKIDFGRLFDSAKGVAGPIKDIATAFSPLGIAVKAIGPALPKIGDALGKVASAVGGVLAQVLPAVADAFVQIGTALAGAISRVLPALVPLFEDLADIIPALGPALSIIVGAVAALASGLIRLLTPILSNEHALKALLAGFLAFKAVQGTLAILRTYRAVQLGLTAATYGTQGAMLVAGTSAKAYGIAMKAQAVAAKVAAVGQRILNVAMKANPIGLIITAITLLVGALVWFFTKTKLGQKIIKVAWAAIKTAISAVADWFTKTMWPAMKRVITSLGNVFRTLGAGIKVVWNGIKTVISAVWKWIKQRVIDAATRQIKAWQIIWRGLKTAVTAVWNGIKSVASTVWKWIKARVIDLATRQIRGWQVIWRALKTAVTTVWNGIKNVARTVWTWVKQRVIDAATRQIRGWQTIWRGLKTVVSAVWSGIKNAGRSAWAWLKERVFAPAKTVLRRFGDAFRGVRDAVKTSWNKIKEYAARPINFVLGTVYNNGLAHWWNTIANKLNIKKWKLPAASMIRFAQGTEDHRAQIARAGAMRVWAEPETGGEAYIPLARSKRGRSTDILGRVAQHFGYGLTPFAGGGFWNAAGGLLSKAWKGAVDLGGKAWDLAKKAGGVVLDFVKNPSGTVTKVAGALVNKLLGGAPGGDLMKMIASLPGKAVSGLASSVKTLVTGSPDHSEGRASGSGPMGSGRTRGVANMTRALHALIPGARVTSGYRGGAVTATGYRSYHGLGRAIDIVGSNMGAIWDKLRAVYGKTAAELFYTPRGFLRFGKMGGAAAVTRRTHYSHVHWAMKNGGLLFDQGGMWPSGRAGYNATGKPEAVLTPAETAGLKAAVQQGPIDLSRATINELAAAILDGAWAVSRRTAAQTATARGAAMRAGARP